MIIRSSMIKGVATQVAEGETGDASPKEGLTGSITDTIIIKKK